MVQFPLSFVLFRCLLSVTLNKMNLLDIIQIVFSVLLIATILLQGKGTGLSTIFGGEGNVFRTKRGFEKILFYITIVLAIGFFGAALLNIYLGDSV